MVFEVCYQAVAKHMAPGECMFMAYMRTINVHHLLLGDIRPSVRPEHMGLVEAVASALEADVVVPYVGHACLRRPNEEDMFLERLQFSSL